MNHRLIAALLATTMIGLAIGVAGWNSFKVKREARIVTVEDIQDASSHTECRVTLALRGGRSVTVFVDGWGASLYVVLRRPGWVIVPGKSVSIPIDFDGAPPNWREPLATHLRGKSVVTSAATSDTLTLKVDGPSTTKTVAAMSADQTMTISFPEGNEPPWKLDLADWKGVLLPLTQCSALYTGVPVGTQPTSGKGGN